MYAQNDLEIDPMPGNALVKLPSSEWGDVPITEKSHNSVSYGEVIAIHSNDINEWEWLIGYMGHWHLYREDVRLGESLAVVELKDILAVSKRKDNK